MAKTKRTRVFSNVKKRIVANSLEKVDSESILEISINEMVYQKLKMLQQDIFKEEIEKYKDQRITVIE